MKKGVGNVTIAVFLVILLGLFIFSFWQVEENVASSSTSNTITGFTFHDNFETKIPQRNKRDILQSQTKKQSEKEFYDPVYAGCLAKFCSDSDAKVLNEEGDPNIKGYLYGKDEKAQCVKVEDTCKDANVLLEMSCPEYFIKKIVLNQQRVEGFDQQINALAPVLEDLEKQIMELAKKIFGPEAQNLDPDEFNQLKAQYNALIEDASNKEYLLEDLKAKKEFAETKAGYEIKKFPPIKTVYCQYGCKNSACQPKPEAPSCKDNKCNQNEDCAAGKSAVPDCGGVCPKCATCYDNKQNQGETGIDCGGPCKVCASCSDAKWNQNEDLIDCGGVCPACSQDMINQCNNGIKDTGETEIDCGGKTCPACKTDFPDKYAPNCFNGILDMNEEKTDCGGDCPPCKSIDPTCSDKKKNGYETGIDCGGPQCPACDVPGKGCTDSDESGEKNNWGFGTPGTVTEKNNPAAYNDECIDGKNLKEFVCSNNKKKEVFYTCKEKCFSDPKGPDYCSEDLVCDDPDVNAGSLVVDYVFGEYEFKFERAIPSTVIVTSTNGKQIASSPDKCEGNTLKEQICNGETGKEIYEYSFDCTFEKFGEQPFDGCSSCNGVGFCCKNEQQECKESDGGKNIAQASMTLIPPLCDCSGFDSGTDTCGISYCEQGSESIETTPATDAYCKMKLSSVASFGSYGDSVKEYYCDGLSIKSQWVVCPEGEACVKGACKPYKTCVDTDAEKYPAVGAVPGQATGLVLEYGKPIYEGTIKDKCLNNEVLLEATCGGANPGENKYHTIGDISKFPAKDVISKILAQPQYYAMYSQHICKVCKPQNGTWKCMGKCVESDQGAYCDITKTTYP